MSTCSIDQLKDIVARLTGPGGCPWDSKQTPETLSEYIIEESHELVSAIRYGEPDDVCEELGDVAFLLVTIAHHFEKQGKFTLDDVFKRNAAKMVHRHPHVFGSEKFESLDEQLKAWEALKKEEHQQEGKQFFHRVYNPFRKCGGIPRVIRDGDTVTGLPGQASFPIAAPGGCPG